MSRNLAVLAILAGATAIVVAQGPPPPDHPAGLRAVSPGEALEVTLHQRLGLDRALESVAQVRGALGSFVLLTDAVRRTMPRRKLKEIGYTDPEMQTIGFHNLPGHLEGTLRLQDWTIKELRWELTTERQKRGAASATEVAEARKALAESEVAFRTFWEGFGIAD